MAEAHIVEGVFQRNRHVQQSHQHEVQQQPHQQRKSKAACRPLVAGPAMIKDIEVDPTAAGHKWPVVSSTIYCLLQCLSPERAHEDRDDDWNADAYHGAQRLGQPARERVQHQFWSVPETYNCA